MSINTKIPISSVTYNGVEIPLKSLDTCTVEITAEYSYTGNYTLSDICATVIEDGVLTSKLVLGYPSEKTTSVTIENVLCGSFVVANFAAYMFLGIATENAEQFEADENGDPPSGKFFKITAPSGGTAKIKYYSTQ